MKKWLTLLLLCLVTGCFSIEEEKPSYPKDRVQEIVEIDYETLTQKLNSKIDFILYVGRPDCQDCREFYPILEDYVNTSQKGIYYLNIKTFRDEANKEDASQEEKDFYTNLREELGFTWTPTLIQFQDGENVSSYQYLDEDYYGLSLDQKQKKKDKYIDVFKSWMNEVY